MDHEAPNMPPFSAASTDVQPLAIVGAGRIGRALSACFTAAGLQVRGPLGRDSDGAGCPVVLLCVPDGEIARAAAAVAPGSLVGHCSGASDLAVLGDREGFSLHPLMTVPAPGSEAVDFEGAAAAVAGSSPRALRVARALADHLRMEAVEIAPEDRAAYHAAASIASNFLVTLEAAAERLAATAGVERRMLVPLVRATVENWAQLGGREALTGPVVRGDSETVERQRAAVRERIPELADLFDALVAGTRALAREGVAA